MVWACVWRIGGGMDSLSAGRISIWGKIMFVTVTEIWAGARSWSPYTSHYSAPHTGLARRYRAPHTSPTSLP